MAAGLSLFLPPGGLRAKMALIRPASRPAATRRGKNGRAGEIRTHGLLHPMQAVGHHNGSGQVSHAHFEPVIEIGGSGQGTDKALKQIRRQWTGYDLKHSLHCRSFRPADRAQGSSDSSLAATPVYLPRPQKARPPTGNRARHQQDAALAWGPPLGLRRAGLSRLLAEGADAEDGKAQPAGEAEPIRDLCGPRCDIAHFQGMLARLQRHHHQPVG